MSIRIAIILIAFVFQPGSALLAAPIEEIVSPPQLNDGWTTGSALNAGFDSTKIRALVSALKADEYLNVHSVLIEHKGKLVYEQYLTGNDQNWGTPIGRVGYDGSQQHDLRSISKSVTAILLGIALATEVDTRLEQPLFDFLDKQTIADESSKRSITLRQVLTMSAGFDWNEMTVPYSSYKNDEIQLYRTQDPISYILNKPLRDRPDQRWYYNGGMTMLVAAAVERISGRPLLEYAEEKLFRPLGISEYTWHRSSAWPREHLPSAASGLRLRPRDLAKIGSLMINNGKWRGKQIVPQAWIELSQHRYRDDLQPWDRDGTYGYGLHWWQGSFPKGDRKIAATTGVGYGGQRLFTAAEIGLSVTIFAGNYGTGRPQSTWQSERIFERILDALF